MTVIGLTAIAWALIDSLPDGGGSGSPILIDLADLQWWQALIGIIGLLGLSPAPWLLGLASGKVAFTAPLREDFNRQLAEKDAAHGRELGTRDAAHVRELESRDRQSEALLATQRERYSDLERSNEANALAAERERKRADEITDAAIDLGEVLRANVHVIASVGEAGRIAATESHNGT